MSSPISSSGHRRNILNLWLLAHQTPQALHVTQAEQAKEDLDRYMIALHRFQNEGKVYLNFVSGVHNGGWYDPEIEKSGIDKLMWANALGDRRQQYYDAYTKGHSDEGSTWPDFSKKDEVTPEITHAFPKKDEILHYVPAIDTPASERVNWWRCHQFCWHAKSPFFLWHRPYMLLFEKLLQYYDVASDSEKQERPIGAHYFAWEDWDGTTLPIAFTTPVYTLMSKKYQNGSASGSFPNPLQRWYSPRSLEDQYNGNFPVLDDENCSTRDKAFLDPAQIFDFPWRIGDDGVLDRVVNPSTVTTVSIPRRSVKHVISDAMNEPHWCYVATVEFSANAAMEESHNRFHNRLGGNKGTMTSNQSPYDPIFWVHHANVERQLVSWQTVHSTPNSKHPEVLPMSRIPDPTKNLRLYPYAKPSIVKKNLAEKGDKITPIEIIKAFISQGAEDFKNDTNTGTMEEWFDAWVDEKNAFDRLHDYITAVNGPSRSGATVGVPRRLNAECKVFNPSQMKNGGSEYILKYTDNKSSTEYLTTTSVISRAPSGACHNCNQRINDGGYKIQFDVTLIPPLQEAIVGHSDAPPEPIKCDGFFELFDHEGKDMDVGPNRATQTDEMILVYARRQLGKCGHKPESVRSTVKSSIQKTSALFAKTKPLHSPTPTFLNFDKETEELIKILLGQDTGEVDPIILSTYRAELGPIIKMYQSGELDSDCVFVNTTVDTVTGDPWMTSRFTGEFSRRFDKIIEESDLLKEVLQQNINYGNGVRIVYVDVNAIEALARK